MIFTFREWALNEGYLDIDDFDHKVKKISSGEYELYIDGKKFVVLFIKTSRGSYERQYYLDGRTSMS
jgi:phage anti-repressor protein